jgi:hypothetical protein
MAAAGLRRAAVSAPVRDGGMQLALCMIGVGRAGEPDGSQQQRLIRIREGLTAGWRSATAAASRRLNIVAPHPICILRPRSADPAGLPDMLGWLIRRIWAAWPLRIDGITAMYLVSRPSFADAATAALAVPCLCWGRCHA